MQSPISKLRDVVSFHLLRLSVAADSGIALMQWWCEAEGKLSLYRFQRTYSQPLLIRLLLTKLLPKTKTKLRGKNSTLNTAQLLCDYWQSVLELGKEPFVDHNIQVSTPFEDATELVRKRHPAVTIYNGTVILPLNLMDRFVLSPALAKFFLSGITIARRRIPMILKSEEGRLADVLLALSRAVVRDIDSLTGTKATVSHIPPGWRFWQRSNRASLDS